MNRSLRYRLLISASLSSVVVLGLLGVSVYLAMRHALLRDFDDSLKTQARLLAGMIDQDGRKITFEFNAEQAPDFLSAKRGHFFEIWQDDGQVLARSPSLGNDQLERSGLAIGAVAATQLPGARSGRAVLLSFTTRQDEQDEEKPAIPSRNVSIMVAAEPQDVSHTLALLGWLLTLLCAGAVIIMGAILLRVVARGLQPVTTLASGIESLRETDLHHRFARDGVPDELLPVVDKLNGLLGRMDAAFVREKSFTADVAHELRTPLAGLRMTLEVCRSRPRETAAYEAALDECREITDRMEAMVESLLLLARSDAGQVVVEKQKVDLSQILMESWCLYQNRATQRELKADCDVPESCNVETDPAKLRIVVQNLLDNAVSYANTGGQIRMMLRQAGPGAMIQIANSGSVIAPESIPRLFERFWRGDSARSDAGLHCGLGLSLAQRIMSLLGGAMSIETQRDSEFIVRLTVP